VALLTATAGIAGSKPRKYLSWHGNTQWCKLMHANARPAQGVGCAWHAGAKTCTCFLGVSQSCAGLRLCEQQAWRFCWPCKQPGACSARCLHSLVLAQPGACLAWCLLSLVLAQPGACSARCLLSPVLASAPCLLSPVLAQPRACSAWVSGQPITHIWALLGIQKAMS